MSRLALYNVLLHTVVAPLLVGFYAPKILLNGKYHSSIAGKLGFLPKDVDFAALKKPVLWFHAVSVGETVALNPLVKAVKRHTASVSIVISTGTETGQAKARELIPEADAFVYLPLDYPELINPVVKTINPDLFVLMETELWPNLIAYLKKNGSTVVLANGRISDRSFPRYLKLKFLFRKILEQIDLFLMSSNLDRERLFRMGAPENRIHVTGNTKFDALPLNTEPDDEIRRILQIKPQEPVFVAGSVHPGEFGIILDLFVKLLEAIPDLHLIIVPRHVERTPEVIEEVAKRALPDPYLRSSYDSGVHRGSANITIVDKTGELFRVYSLASVVFVGGSLVPKGGQNIIEPAVWGKITLFGPSMNDFREAKDILQRVGIGIQVYNQKDLLKYTLDILLRPEQYKSKSEKGRTAVLEQAGSAERNAVFLMNILSEKSNKSIAAQSESLLGNYTKKTDNSL